MGFSRGGAATEEAGWEDEMKPQWIVREAKELPEKYAKSANFGGEEGPTIMGIGDLNLQL